MDMILFINTSQTNLIQLKLIKDDKVVGQLENREEYKHSELLLGMIEKIIPDQRSKIQDLKSIAVVSGFGAFSALRLGVTTANALAWALRVPIVELSVDQVQNDEKLISAINKKTGRLEDWKIEDFKPVVPKYGKEPNITHSTSSRLAGFRLGLKNNQ